MTWIKPVSKDWYTNYYTLALLANVPDLLISIIYN